MPTPIDPPFLVTLGFDRPTFEALDALRSEYFPPTLNFIPAHVSMFHHLPGDEFEAIDRALLVATRSAEAIPLAFPTLKRMARGLMLAVEAPGLAEVHAGLARAFDRWLTPQDRQAFRPHVTIMNKATRAEVDRAEAELLAGWSPQAGSGDRLILWRYLGGPWDEVASYEFGTPTKSTQSERFAKGDPR